MGIYSLVGKLVIFAVVGGTLLYVFRPDAFEALCNYLLDLHSDLRDVELFDLDLDALQTKLETKLDDAKDVLSQLSQDPGDKAKSILVPLLFKRTLKSRFFEALGMLTAGVVGLASLGMVMACALGYFFKGQLATGNVYVDELEHFGARLVDEIMTTTGYLKSHYIETQLGLGSGKENASV